MSKLAQALFLWLAIVLITGSARAGGCDDSDLLAHLKPLESRGVDHPALLTDAWLTPEGRNWDVPEAARMVGIRPMVSWELPPDTHITAATIQADHDDDYRILVSDDGHNWTVLWTAELVKDPGLRERKARDLDATARFVRFEAMGGDRNYSATEVRLFCRTPEPFPPPSAVRASLIEDPDATLTMWLRCAKVILGLSALFLFLVVAPRAQLRVRNAIGWTLLVAGLAAWTQFGFFQGKGELLHAWDQFHYYMGSKYFRELGYFDLYRCVAKAEREAGRGAELDHALIRNLEDSRIYPGTWAREDAARCRATFTPDRWGSFKHDIAAFRGLFAKSTPFVMAVSDHGFNATPIHAAWLKWWSSTVHVSRAGLTGLAQLDSLSLLGALAFIYWGFGIEACAVVSLIVGLGLPWGYNWVGGSFGRLVWLLWVCAGLALLRKDRPFLGAAALTVSGLLRLFPMIFVGGMGLCVVVQWVKHRRLSVTSKRILAGFAITTALGLAFGGTAAGFGKYRDFVHTMDRHSHTPLTNQMGLATFLGSGPGRHAPNLVDQRLTDPYELWKDAQLTARHERAPLWVFAMLVSTLLIAYAAHRGASPWECAALSGPLLFSSLAMTSYDYSWLLVMVPVAMQSKKRLFWLLGYVVYTEMLSVYEPDLEVQHIEFSWTLLIALTAFSIDVVRTYERAHVAQDQPAPT